LDKDSRQKLIENFNSEIKSYLDHFDIEEDFFNPEERNIILDFILSEAIQEVYSKDEQKYKKIKAPSSGKAEIPKDFHLGLKKLAERLQVQVHDRAPVTIEACRIVIEKIVQAKNGGKRDKKENRFDHPPLGMDTGDSVMNQVALVMRLLHNEEMRSLQTEANRIIVETQKLTANPITNTKLGRVGR